MRWYLPGNTKLVWQPAPMCGSVYGYHLSQGSDALVLFWSVGSALTLPLFLLSRRMVMLCQCSLTITTDNLLVIVHDIKWPLHVDIHLSLHPLTAYSTMIHDLFQHDDDCRNIELCIETSSDLLSNRQCTSI